jgi:predicted peptidase
MKYQEELRMRNCVRALWGLFLCLLLLGGMTVTVEAESPNQLMQRFEAHVFTDAQGKTLPYRLLKPKNLDPTKSYPLVLFFHGAGERGTDNLAQIRNGAFFFATNSIMEKYPCFVVAPQCPTDKRWVEVNWDADAHVMPVAPSEPMRLTLLLLDALQHEYKVDARRLYVTGLSMGGFGTWDIIARRPALFAAAVPVCGGGDEATAEAIKKVPIWAFHGDQDGAVKTTRSRHMIEALRKVDAHPKYTELLNVGHNAWDFAYCSSDMYEWLFAQHKKR